MCGEHSVRGDRVKLVCGSSPRVWGTYNYSFSGISDLRFIPTCVGNIFHNAPGASSISVHPHVCGEHVLAVVSYRAFRGSSPRVWGTSDYRWRSSSNLRFIPTCVGNIITSRHRGRIRAVHPHVCGEHMSNIHPIQRIPGSSPRVWGTFPNCNRGQSDIRFIPTCVGNITVCEVCCPIVRFIPTCVGNIKTHSIEDTRFAVHPHVCGEHNG